MSGHAYGIHTQRLPSKTWSPFAGSVVVAKSGTRDLALISVTTRLSPGEMCTPRSTQRMGDSGQNWPSTFLDNDYCVVNDEDFFVRGLICLPVIGSRETLRWGVWGSLSRDNFEKLWRMKDDSKRVELPAMFSWLNTRIPDYPDTLALKMYACIQEPGCRPYFELEPTDHPLSRDFHHGITAERVKEIMFRRLQGNE